MKTAVCYITVEDISVINNALGRGEDVRIVRVPGGVKIQSQKIRTLKKKTEESAGEGAKK